MKRLFCLISILALAGAAAGAATLDGSIKNAARDISKKLPKGARIAVAAFPSETEKVSEYVVEELASAFAGRGLEVADRLNLAYIKQQAELRSRPGEESDQDLAGMGALWGADFMVSGSFLPQEDVYRLTVITVDVKTARRGAGSQSDVKNDRTLQTKLSALNSSKSAARSKESPGQQKNRTAGSWLDEGITFASVKRFDEAVNAFTQALKVNAKFSAAYLQRGKALYASIISGNRNFFWKERESASRAIADLSEVVRLNPTVSAYHYRGQLYDLLGDYDQAIADYSKVISLNANYAAAYNNRGAAYRNKGDFDKAIEDLNQAVKLNPAAAGQYVNRGLAYTDKGDYDLAIADYTQALSLDPLNADAYSNRGVACYHKGELNSAIADWEAALKINPGHTSARNNLHTAYFNRGNSANDKEDYDRAVADYTQAVRLDPNDADAYSNRGAAYYRKGDLSSAVADWEAALKINPRHTSAKNNLDSVRKQRRPAP